MEQITGLDIHKVVTEAYPDIRAAVKHACYAVNCKVGADVQEDFVQNVATKLALSDIDPTKSLRAYIRMIAKNLVIDYMRNPRNDLRNVDTDTLADVLAAPSDTTADDMADMRATVEAALVNAPATLRAMWEEYTSPDYSDAAYAAKHGLTPNAHRIRKCRFLKQIRDLIV